LNGASYKTLAEAQAAGVPTLNYGVFINTVIDFIIVAFVIFMVVKRINSMKKAPPPADPSTKECPFCISQVPLKASKCPNCTSDLKTA
jgi:large conductance mechanosensitive channel